MFENEYRKEMDTITPDEQVKTAVKAKILHAEKTKAIPQRKFRSASLPRICFAATACAAIMLAALFIPKSRPAVNNPEFAGKESVLLQKDSLKGNKYYSTAGSYNTLYDKLKEIYNYNYTQDELMYEYSSAADSAVKGSSSKATGSAADAADGSRKSNDYSETTTQTEGVDEADIVKTDGKYIYFLNTNSASVKIASAGGNSTSVLSSLDLNSQDGYNYFDMYVYGDRITVIGTYSAIGAKYGNNAVIDSAYIENDETVVTVIDITDRSAPKIVKEFTQSGSYSDSRMTNGKVYIISGYYVFGKGMEKDRVETYAPYVKCGNDIAVTAPDNIMIKSGDINSTEYLVIGTYDISEGKLLSTCSVLGGAGTIYCSTENIITADSRWLYNENGSSHNYTVISRFSINEGPVKYITSAEIDGELLNQFSIDEYNGYFRFVFTENSETTQTTYRSDGTVEHIMSSEFVQKNALRILDGNLSEVGSITDIAPNEEVYSVRFMGDTVYFVTFRQTDPLFSADISDPTNPTLTGELKIPGFSNFLYPYGEGKLLGIGRDADESTGRSGEMKLSMFNINDPANVSEEGKLILENNDWTPALYNHKATLISAGKNLIGFATESDSTHKAVYNIYSYENGSFKRLAEIPLANENGTDTYSARGVFVGSDIYVICNSGIRVFTLESFEQTAAVDF